MLLCRMRLTTGIASVSTLGYDSPSSLVCLSHRAPSTNSPFTYTPTVQTITDYVHVHVNSSSNVCDVNHVCVLKIMYILKLELYKSQDSKNKMT